MQVKKCVSFFLMALVIFTGNGLCQNDEEIGLVQRLWRKFRGTEQPSGQPVKQAAPLRSGMANNVIVEDDNASVPREVMIDEIRDELDLYGDLISEKIPAVKISKDETTGDTVVSVKTENGLKRLDDLDDDTLMAVHSTVMNVGNKVSSEELAAFVEQEQLRKTERESVMEHGQERH